MIHFTTRILQMVATAGCVSSSAYYLFCLWSAAVFLRQRKQACLKSGSGTISLPAELPAVSILKPLKGTDPDIYQSFRSQCLQDYPSYELIFGVSDADDPAVSSVRQLQREFPQLVVRLVVCSKSLGENVKVSNLEQMLQMARFDHLIVNDSDVRVETDYIRSVMVPLTDPSVGMVTCLYRGVPTNTLGSKLESLGISTDFCPGVLVACQLENGIRFGLGSTMAFRRNDLERIGGFRSIIDYLADDYELGRRIAALGLQVKLSEVVVETHLPVYDFRGFATHQTRWARGVRDSRRRGYIGLVFTFGLLWALLTVIASHAAAWAWAVLGVVGMLRLAVALVVGKSVLHDQTLIRNLWLLPARDLTAVAVWVTSFFGHTVTWRGDRFRLKNGRLIRINQRSSRRW
jgi:ceramide glucosyltransferase